MKQKDKENREHYKTLVEF